MNGRVSEANVGEDTARARSSTALAVGRTVLLIPATFVCISGCLVFKHLARSRATSLAACTRWTHYWFRAAAHIIGIDIESEGDLPKPGTYIAPNHLGYCDIIAIGALLPTLFVAKIDVASWPVMGFLFRSSEHVGVPRSRTKGLAVATQAVTERLNEGASVCIFLEGTSSGGDTVRPFHGALLQPALATEVAVRPTSLTWTIDAPGGCVAEDIAYWKDHEFVAHFWRLLGLRDIHVLIRFGKETTLDPDTDRKAAAQQIRETVVGMLDTDEVNG